MAKGNVETLKKELKAAQDEHLAALSPSEKEPELRERVRWLKAELAKAEANQPASDGISERKRRSLAATKRS